jgi:hypothetical protein
MDRERQKDQKFSAGGNAPLAASVGALLLELRNALRQAERCRLALRSLGYSQKHWQEIIKDVTPELRFALRPSVLDSIVSRLESVGKPVPRQSLVRVLLKQEVGPPQRIQQAITANLRGILVLHSGDRIGLAAWQEEPEHLPSQRAGKP